MAQNCEAVLGFAAEWRAHQVLGVEHRLHDTGVAALREAVEMLLQRSHVGGDLLRCRIVPLAVDFDNVPLLAGHHQRLVDAVVTVAVDPRCRRRRVFRGCCRRSADACRAVQPNRPQALLVDVDVDRVFTIENIVERHQDDARVVGALDPQVESRRVLVTTIASKPESMKLLIAAICMATSSPVETTLNSLSWAAMSGCAAKALAVWIIWMRQVLAMKPVSERDAERACSGP